MAGLPVLARRKVASGPGELVAVRLEPLGGRPAAVWRGHGGAALLVGLLDADGDAGAGLEDAEEALRLQARANAAEDVLGPGGEAAGAVASIGLPRAALAAALADDDWFRGLLALADRARSAAGASPGAAFAEAFLALRRRVDERAGAPEAWDAAARRQHAFFGNGRLASSAAATAEAWGRGEG